MKKYTLMLAFSLSFLFTALPAFADADDGIIIYGTYPYEYNPVEYYSYPYDYYAPEYTYGTTYYYRYPNYYNYNYNPYGYRSGIVYDAGWEHHHHHHRDWR